MESEQTLRELICELGRRMYDKNLVSATDGNLSVKLEPDRYLITPSGVSKGFMRPDDIVVANGAGEKVSRPGKVSSEFFTHLACYEERPEIQAVVHAHPPKAVACTLAGFPLTEYLLPEVVFALGGIPVTDYATPGTIEGAGVIRELIRECDAVLLDRHGAVTIGLSLLDAYYKMEKIEHAAETIITACILGTPKSLTDAQFKRILVAREAYGSVGKLYPNSGKTS